MTALASFAAILLLVFFYGEGTNQEQVAEKNEEAIFVDENTFYPNVNVQHVHATQPNEHVKIQKKNLKKLPAVSRSEDRKSTRLNSSHVAISYAVFCLKKKTNKKY